MAAFLGGDIDDALEHLRLPAHLVDRDGLVRWQNAKSIAHFGDMHGRPFAEMVAPEARPAVRAEFAKKVLGMARASTLSTVLRSPAGERVSVELNCVAVESGERVVGVFAIVDLDPTGFRPPPARGGLTPRQHEVLLALARGCSTLEIAEETNLSSETVRNHVRGALRALRVHSRVAAVAEGRRLGLID